MASKLLMISVFVVDLIAFGLAVAAELKRNTAQIHINTEYTYSYCVYDSDIATGFGVGAFLFLMATQFLIMVASRCFCCGRALIPGPSRTCALLLFIISWVTFFIASGFLLVGSVRNSHHTTDRVSFLLEDIPFSCETLRKGVFAGGAAFILFTAIISEFYYVSYSEARLLEVQDNTVQLLT
ncbi:uncharacterized protein LOC116014804 [Ipomoea triloba]|uniref:uncharacterized protein LOC116014804 n=1 Tax=Ipomoea triloba TaxID=35885 RepID=UPI00125D6DB5|nr:uncharacterized protein LOC116014804 [Ipomoea triloba]